MATVGHPTGEVQGGVGRAAGHARHHRALAERHRRNTAMAATADKRRRGSPCQETGARSSARAVRGIELEPSAHGGHIANGEPPCDVKHRVPAEVGGGETFRQVATVRALLLPQHPGGTAPIREVSTRRCGCPRRAPSRTRTEPPMAPSRSLMLTKPGRWPAVVGSKPAPSSATSKQQRRRPRARRGSWHAAPSPACLPAFCSASRQQK